VLERPPGKKERGSPLHEVIVSAREKGKSDFPFEVLGRKELPLERRSDEAEKVNRGRSQQGEKGEDV